METSKLLKDSQEQSEQLRAQEEELRQNMEEIQAAQDEMHRKQRELEGALEEANEKSKVLAQNETEMKVASQRMQLIIDNMPSAVYWKDSNLVYTGCNKVFVQRLGKTDCNEIIGKTDYELVSKDKAEHYRKEDVQVMEKKKPSLNTYSGKKGKNGQVVVSKVNKIPLLDDNKKAVGIIGIIDDNLQAG
jgi:PAS domain-containing protein